jgi:hypothetical protein
MFAVCIHPYLEVVRAANKIKVMTKIVPKKTGMMASVLNMGKAISNTTLLVTKSERTTFP